MSVSPQSGPTPLEPLAEDQWPDETTVVIVGGGPVGLSAATLLAQSGIDVFLLERRGFEFRFPRAHLLNVRTMEVFERMGVADDIYRAGPKDDRWRKVAWYTSVAGNAQADGIKIGEVPAWGGGEDAVRYAQASPMKFANLPQLRLDPLLHRHAESACPGRIRAWQEVTDIGEDGDGVVITFVDRQTGATRQIRAAFAIVADGGRTSKDLLGLELDGRENIREVVNYHVSTDLSSWSEPDALLCFFFHPAGGRKRMGTIQALGPKSYDRNSEEWLVAVPGWMRNDDSEAAALDSIRRVLGLPEDHSIKLHSESHWVYNGVVARHWRRGRIFIAGDAAHRHPPTGGLGLNSGVQDAENLSWKLAAVLKGQAEDSLLDSYEWERRPVTARYTAHSLENAAMHAPIADAMGLSSDECESRRAVAAFLSDTSEGEAIRRRVATAVSDNAHDYSQLNIEAGFFYTAGAFVADGSQPPENAQSPIEFSPTTRPGHHIPHVWLRHVREASPTVPVSTRDLVDRDGLTLFVGDAAAESWQTAAVRVGEAMPVRVVVIPAEDTAWHTVSEVGLDGAVLVRPDAKNAWRVDSLPDDPTAALRVAVSTVTRGGSAPEHDPAEESLQRILEVAGTLVD